MWNPFQATHRERDVFRIPVPHSGTQYAPVLEWALAARWWGYRSLEAFQQLSGSDQSFLIAVYRTAHQIEAVEAWEQHRHGRA